ncbi:lasso peptide biosynthesis protein [Ktedonobacter racemifer]
MHLLFLFGPPASLEENEESKGLCIPRSLGLCAYLRALGLPAQLVLACARFSYGSGTQAYHAWTEVATHPINEAPEIVFGYAELMRFPVLAEDIENAMRR